MILRIMSLLMLMCFHISANADDSRPIYLEIAESNVSGTYRMQWRLPPNINQNNLPNILLPEICQRYNNQLPALNGQARFHCEKNLSGQVIAMSFPVFRPANATLLKITFLSGEQHTLLYGPEERQWKIPHKETASKVAKDYTLLGMHHIWAGNDHLLFLLCLLWIAGGLRRILITVTGFTLAHSATLALSALHIINLNVKVVEAVIALSIVFLAMEIVKNNKHSLTWCYPIAVSSSFGLIHGLGFAAVLAEIGLPQTELYTGLLFFNLGVEIGQVIFVLAVMALFHMVKRMAFLPVRIGQFKIGLGYLIGSVASFWIIERLVS